MRVSAVVEWVGGQTGWRASARLKNGREVCVNRAHTLLAARRRLRRALEELGVSSPEIAEDLRIPQVLLDEIAELRALREDLDRRHADFTQKRMQLAQRLLTELSLTEKEVADWLGISATRLAKILQEHSTDTTGSRPGD